MTPWDERLAREGIAAIVADAESALGGVAWPLDERDRDDEFIPADLTTLYLGAGEWKGKAGGYGIQDVVGLIGRKAAVQLSEAQRECVQAH